MTFRCLRNLQNIYAGVLIFSFLTACGGPNVELVSLLNAHENGAGVENARERLLNALDAGANPDTASLSYTPLLLAIEWRDIELVKTLLQAGADINGRAGQKPPVTAAAEQGATDIVRLLLDAGANPDRDPHNYYSALGEAVGGRHLETIQLLLDRNPSVKTLSDALSPAACSGFIDLYEMLLQAGAKAGDEENLLACAIGTMKPAMVEYLLPALLSANDPGMLYAAAAANLNRPAGYRQEAKQIFTILLSSGIKPPAGSLDEALQLAQEMNDADAIEFLSQYRDNK